VYDVVGAPTESRNLFENRNKKHPTSGEVLIGRKFLFGLTSAVDQSLTALHVVCQTLASTTKNPCSHADVCGGSSGRHRCAPKDIKGSGAEAPLVMVLLDLPP